MSSAIRVPSQIPVNKLYVNLKSVPSSIVDTNLSPVSWTTAFSPLTTAGNTVLRDMGKTVYLPAVSGASQSTVLRKIQLVPSGASGYFGTGAGTGAAADGGAQEYYTGYIELGGQTYGGGNGVPAGFVRLN